MLCSLSLLAVAAAAAGWRQTLPPPTTVRSSVGWSGGGWVRRCCILMQRLWMKRCVEFTSNSLIATERRLPDWLRRRSRCRRSARAMSGGWAAVAVAAVSGCRHPCCCCCITWFYPTMTTSNVASSSSKPAVLMAWWGRGKQVPASQTANATTYLLLLPCFCLSVSVSFCLSFSFC